METLRLSIFALVLFALAFVGISWAGKGFPLMAMRTEPIKPIFAAAAVPARAPAVAAAATTHTVAAIPTFEESVKVGRRQDWEDSKTVQSDGDKERDKLRLALWQAAIGYKLSPCDETMKRNLVAALTRYTNAWAAMAGCKGAVCNGGDKKLDTAAAAFKTPADTRVLQELHEAFEQGGIGRDDFPKPIRTHVLMFSGTAFGEPRAACIQARRKEAHR